MSKANVKVFIKGEHFTDFKLGEVVPAYAIQADNIDRVEVEISSIDVMYVGDRQDIKNKIASGPYQFIACTSDTVKNSLSWRWI